MAWRQTVSLDSPPFLLMATVLVPSVAIAWLVPPGMLRLAPVFSGLAVGLACWVACGYRQRLGVATVQRDQAFSSLDAACTRVREIRPEAVQSLSLAMSQLEQAGSGVVAGIDDLAHVVQAQVSGMGDLAAESRCAGEAFAATVQVGAREVAGVSETASRQLDQVQAGIAELVAGMTASLATHETLADVTRDLQGQTDAIRQITRTVSDLARQSSMLALNASIEAARSGHEGRGFAVVAEEFRRLSDETQKAATTIAGLVETVDGGVQNAVVAIGGTCAAMVRHQAEAVAVRDGVGQIHSAMECVNVGAAMLSDHTAAFSSQQADLQRRLQDAANQAEGLQVAVFALFEHLQFSDISRQELGRLADLLAGLGDVAGDPRPAGEVAHEPPALRQLVGQTAKA